VCLSVLLQVLWMQMARATALVFAAALRRIQEVQAQMDLHPRWARKRSNCSSSLQQHTLGAASCRFCAVWLHKHADPAALLPSDCT
jgi:hypothetical protein